MNEDKVSLKANLTLTKEEIIDRVVDQQMEPLEREAQTKANEHVVAHEKWEKLHNTVSLLARKYSRCPELFVSEQQKAALAAFTEAFPSAEKCALSICEFGCSEDGEHVTGWVIRSNHNYREYLVDLSLTGTLIPADLKSAMQADSEARKVQQEAKMAYDLARSKCDSEARSELRKQVKNQLVDRLFKEINGSLQKLLAPVEE